MPEVEGLLRYSVTECLKMLGVSRAHFYRQVKAGRYEVVRDRGRTFMTVEQLQAAIRGDVDNEGMSGL